jgi:probable HAF family extracellular repeat protein
VKFIISLGLLLVSMAVGPVRAYTVVDLGELGKGGSTATAINSRGDVVGSSLLNKELHAFLCIRGTPMRDLGVGGAFGVNASGEVVGYSGTRLDSGAYTAGTRGFVYSGGRVRLLPVLPRTYLSVAAAINTSGEITGFFTVNGTLSNPFLYRNGVISEIPNPEPYVPQLSAYGVLINDRGQVVIFGERDYLYTAGAFQFIAGQAGCFGMNNHGEVVGNNDSPFWWENGVGHQLRGATGNLSGGTAMAVNDAGEIVGFSDGVACIFHIAYPQPATPIVVKGWTLSEAIGINNAGEIAANGTRNGTTISHALLLIP